MCPGLKNTGAQKPEQTMANHPPQPQAKMRVERTVLPQNHPKPLGCSAPSSPGATQRHPPPHPAITQLKRNKSWRPHSSVPVHVSAPGPFSSLGKVKEKLDSVFSPLCEFFHSPHHRPHWQIKSYLALNLLIFVLIVKIPFNFLTFPFYDFQKYEFMTYFPLKKEKYFPPC